MDIDLTRLSEAELIDLNQRILERIRTLRLQRCRSAMDQFSIGERVSFRPDCGHEVIGRIVRMNVRSITVVSAQGQRWRVGPGLLKRASADNTPEPSDHMTDSIQATLIDLAERQRDRGKA